MVNYIKMILPLSTEYNNYYTKVYMVNKLNVVKLTKKYFFLSGNCTHFLFIKFNK